jgi:hypothetical protein
MAGMQPIKLGAKGKAMEEGFIAPPTKDLLLDDEDENDPVGQDTVLLSRSEPSRLCVDGVADDYSQRRFAYHRSEQ